MRLSWGLAFLMGIWITASLLCALCEGAWAATDEQTVLDDVFNSRLFQAEDAFGKVWGLFSPDLWGALLKAATFDFEIFYGDWAWVRFIVFMPISIAVVVTFALTMYRMVRGGV